MSEVLRLHGLGAVVEVRCTGAAASELAAAMRIAWSRCLEDPGNLISEPLAEPFDVELVDPAHLAQRMMTTTQNVTRALITARAGDLLMLHAGAVSHPTTGASLVYVAPGGTGKTTLSQRLSTRFGYLTDETVGVDETEAILPYPKPLSIRPSGSGGPKDEVSPDQLGLRQVSVSPVAARMVLLDRQPDLFTAMEVEELRFMDALFALTEQTSSLSALRGPLRRLEALIDHTGPVLRYRYREAADIEEALAALIGGDA